MITKKLHTSTSLRNDSKDRGCRFSRSNAQCTIQEECERVSLTRTTSVRSTVEFPPNIDEKDLEILGEIGSGSYGRAIKVKHRQSNCLLVLKEVIEQNKAIEATIVREVSLLQNLKHPNILTIVGVVIRNRQFCLITEYIEKGSLHSLCLDKIRYSFDWIKIITFGRDIASGMAYLHKHDVIHRDLTTNNCLVRQDDSVVVSDFGLSKLVQSIPSCKHTTTTTNDSVSIIQDSSSDTSNNTDVHCNHTHRLRRHHAYNHPRRHTVVGSPYWMAPEMIADQPYDNSVDVYSFGTIMCQLILRSNADPDSLIRDVKTLCIDMNELMKLEKFPINTPPILLNMTSQCVSLDPRNRPCFDSCIGLLEQCLLYLLSGHQSQQVIVRNSAEDISTVNDNNAESVDSGHQNLDVNKH
ncbi:protein kinase [Schistosoma mansoni]|uniref:dual-specificity kinase n=1 Tax=Schistosoma mansoni TaxID=6183 RepID=G4VDM2_SCHMA|nr:protein kinase [Schistosoma mansoni]|eukprot:XP_018650573.1 protein kinase [Schistosoma mansoni]